MSGAQPETILVLKNASTNIGVAVTTYVAVSLPQLFSAIRVIVYDVGVFPV